MKNDLFSKMIFLILVMSLFFPSMVSAKDYVIGDQKNPAEIPSGATYVGAEKCKMCHPDKYNDWATTGHKYKLNTPDEILAVRPDLPFPAGYSQDDILYVIGGWGWKARYLDKDGFIITITGDNKDVNGSNQYNVANGKWSDYHPGEVTKFDCTRCHNTGSSYDSNQGSLKGMVGSWEFRGIQCEACHGPGSKHIASGGGKGVAITVDSSASMCGQCHRRGADDGKIPVSGNFIEHHEQYQELLSSGGMSGMDCVDCHDPHKPVAVGATNEEAGKGIITLCENQDCHAGVAAEYEGTVMQKEGVTCIDCHMPRASKSAIAVSDYEADVRTHIFRIDTAENAEFAYTDPAGGKTYAKGYLTVDYSCLASSCHADKDRAWAASYAPKAMTLQPEDVEKPTTKPIPGFGIVLSALSLFAVLMFRKR